MLNNQLSLSKKSIEEGIIILINKEKNWTSFDVVKKIGNWVINYLYGKIHEKNF